MIWCKVREKNIAKIKKQIQVETCKEYKNVFQRFCGGVFFVVVVEKLLQKDIKEIFHSFTFSDIYSEQIANSSTAHDSFQRGRRELHAMVWNSPKMELWRHIECMSDYFM